MWQIVAVIITGIAVVFYVGYKIFRMISNARHGKNPCDGCPGCALKSQMGKAHGCDNQ